MRIKICALSVIFLALLGPGASLALEIDLEGDWQSSLRTIRTALDSQTDVEPGQDVLLSLLEYATASGYLAELLDFTTRIGVGVERSAAGIEDNPLTDLINNVGIQFGPGAATVVQLAFDRLVASLGESLLAPVEPITLPPAFDINNGVADEATVSLPTGSYILDIGSPENVGDGELARVILGLVDSDGDDNDVEQILNEIMTGTSGANLDFEREPGIVGVELVDISVAHFILGIEDDGFIDLLEFTGPGVEAVLANYDLGGGGSVPVPEPGTFLMMGAGLLGLAGLGRKKLRKS